MTLYDILVPVIALTFAGAAVLVVHLTDKRHKSTDRTK